MPETDPLPETVDAREEQAPVGAITEVHGPVVVIACDRLPPLHQALYSSINHETYLFEVHQHLDKRHARAITLHRTAGLRRDTQVYDTGAPLHVPVTADCLGRLLNIFVEPLDGGVPLLGQTFRNIHSRPAPLREAVGVGNILETGIKVIDLLEDLKARRENFDYEIREINRVIPSMTDKTAPIVTTVHDAIHAVLGQDPTYVASPGSYDQKHRVSRLRRDKADRVESALLAFRSGLCWRRRCIGQAAPPGRLQQAR